MRPTNESGLGAAVTAHEAIETTTHQSEGIPVNDTPNPAMIEAADKLDARADEQEAGGLPVSIIEISRKVAATLRTITSEDLTAGQYVACRTGALLLAELGSAELAEDVQLAADMHHYAAVTAEGGDCGCPACRNAQHAIDEGRDDESDQQSCPRCSIRTLTHPAMSRVSDTEVIKICGPCGSDEAVGLGVVPVTEWPIGSARDDEPESDAEIGIEINGQQFWCPIPVAHQIVDDINAAIREAVAR